MISLALASTLHDPTASMLDQTIRILPGLQNLFPFIGLRASTTTHPDIIQFLRAAGVMVDNNPAPGGDGQKLGLARAQAIDLTLHCSPSHILYCDFDRVLHWAENYPDELSQISQQLQDFDFTVLGRTERAWQTHPRVQRDTEAIINHVFYLVSGMDWDVSAGARGLSKRAAQAILSGCKDENLSTDVSWPLYLKSISSSYNGYAQHYIQNEGLEFETQDRCTLAVNNAGGIEAWMKQFDSDPNRWAERLELADGHLRAMLSFVQKENRSSE